MSDETVCILVWHQGRECYWPAQEFLTNPPAGAFTLKHRIQYPEPVLVDAVQYPMPLAQPEPRTREVSFGSSRQQGKTARNRYKYKAGDQVDPEGYPYMTSDTRWKL